METQLLWDLLPEEFPYEDKGCELFPSCLACPFPHCIDEEPRGRQRRLKEERRHAILRLHRSGKSTGELAQIFGVSQRTIQRALAPQTAKRRQVHV